MRRLISFLPLFTLFLFPLHAQVKIGDNPETIEGSAVLELESTSQGFLLPRMTTAQREAIASPVGGLLVFDTDINGLVVYDGTAWLSLNASSAPGTPGGSGRSCKDILDSGGSVGDGIYEIDPDGDGTAFECYCDMTTDGGGWTLIGRGREGWAWSNSGKQTSNVHLNVGTVSAFTPAYYNSSVINDILGKDLHTLTDGLRIKRNAHYVTDGSAYQEVRWFFSSADDWSWKFHTSITLSNVTVDGATYSTMSGVNTRDSNWRDNGNNHTRVFTWGWGSHGSTKGFSYGSSVNLGTNSSTNFLWENGSENHSIPYTEVYVRE